MNEWGEDKWKENFQKHGVDFADAALIFDNPVIETIDDRKQYGEMRYRALGHVEDDYYIVVYTWRGKDRRIISAWKVGENGKRRYQAILTSPTQGTS